MNISDLNEDLLYRILQSCEDTHSIYNTSRLWRRILIQILNDLYGQNIHYLVQSQCSIIKNKIPDKMLLQYVDSIHDEYTFENPTYICASCMKIVSSLGSCLKCATRRHKRIMFRRFWREKVVVVRHFPIKKVLIGPCTAFFFSFCFPSSDLTMFRHCEK